MRIFLDANILFSAAKSDGPVRALIQALLDAGHQCCVDGFVIEEARRNLVAKSDAEAQAALAPLLERMQVGAAMANARLPQAALVLPEKDRPVMSAAIANACDRLVTGDRTHFGPLYGKTIAGVKVCAPAALAQELL
ncbi:MAG: PIN domain-containing protein [Betaproteobacteria bacterium]|nr:PIN domain-containing protein [Betaproteobacteria bacterium]